LNYLEQLGQRHNSGGLKRRELTQRMTPEALGRKTIPLCQTTVHSYFRCQNTWLSILSKIKSFILAKTHGGNIPT
jgi:hypothetical protein